MKSFLTPKWADSERRPEAPIQTLSLRKTLKSGFLGLIAVFFAILFDVAPMQAQAPGSTCATAACLASGATFPAVTGGGNTNTYLATTCLGSSPNESWFYFQVTSPGTVIQNISINPSSDVDYAAWGPFASTTAGCGNLSAANNVSCNYSSSNGGTMNFTASVGYYLVVLTNFGNQSGTVTMTVNTGTAAVACPPPPPPAITVTETSGTTNNDGIICVGATATLTAPSGTAYAWSTGSNTAAINVTPASTTTYTVSVTAANGSSITSTTTITVNPLPTPAITVAETSGTTANDGIICAGASATITASGGTSYAWSTGANTAAITATPASTTTYTVTVTNANGCSATSTRTITVNPIPTPAIAVTETSGTTNNDGQICAGASASLTASGGGTYAWSTGATTAAITVTPASTLTYTITVTNANGCSATATTTITVNPFPTPATTVAETSGSTANDGIICAGASATITGTGGGTYSWSTGANTAAITVTPASTTTYTVTVTSAAGCTATSTRTITVNPLPTPAIAVTETSGATPNDAIICNGASATLTASGGTSYAWTTGATTAAITVTPASTTTYTITVTNANGCSATASTTITVNPLPTNTFTVTGGGGFCQGSSTVPVGLSGSQTGVNYQLQINGTNNGAPVAGTGAALNFGNFNVVGTYTVIGTTVATSCSTTMTGSVTVFSFNCNATISDPCVCLNNATTLTNGQFGEQIKVNAPSNQTWTVSAVTGLYTTGSPAPPAAPIAITVGTVLTNIGGNMFTLDGRHIDAIGYTISVTNGAGTTLSIGNSCQYPNPSITSDLAGPFCLYSAPVTLTGNPGDGSVTSQTFTVNGTTTTTFNPGAGVGQYTIVYTVNGGTPKATGPNDPGCTQSVSKIVNVVTTPSSLICNDLVYVSLDVDCITEILPDDILEGTYGCDDDYIVELDKTAPYGNGPWVPATVNASDIGQSYQVRVTHLVSGNKCWGNVKIEDKLAPEIECTDIDLSCPITNYDPNYLKNTLNIADAYPDVVECSAYTLSYVDTWHDLACNQGFNGVQDLSAYVTRKWTAKDASNNTSTCIQYIYFHRVHVGDVDFPADFVVNCGANVNTSPAVTGVPYYKDFGINWKLFPDPGFCELQAAYTDQILPVCDGTYKILRTWTLVDWCLPTTPYPPTQNPQYYIQLIKVLDSQGPAMTCPANLTVSTDPYNCCATTNLPDVIIKDNCSRVNNIGAMVTTFDPYTGDQTGMYTVDGALTTFPGNNYWDLDTLGNWGWTPCLPVGRHTVVYTAEDDCGNTSTCSFKLTVADYQPPVAACDQYTVVAIGTDDPADCYTPANGCDGAGVTWVKAKTFDDGSTDNCNGIHFTIRRMDPYSDCINGLEDCEKPNATEERDSIKFYCCEVGTTQTVILRVYQVDADGAIMNGPDGTPLFNECMVNVEVQDKIKPVCQPPANVTVACENFDASLWVYGKANVYDNCCLDTTKVYQGQCGLSHSANYNLFDTVCNKGTITRTFKAYDCHGLTSQCTQRVVV
ncbi:MAG: HYR domain-containing protein, partial [Bacteroidota bacterium]